MRQALLKTLSLFILLASVGAVSPAHAASGSSSTCTPSATTQVGGVCAQLGSTQLDVTKTSIDACVLDGGATLNTDGSTTPACSLHWRSYGSSITSNSSSGGGVTGGCTIQGVSNAVVYPNNMGVTYTNGYITSNYWGKGCLTTGTTGVLGQTGYGTPPNDTCNTIAASGYSCGPSGLRTLSPPPADQSWECIYGGACTVRTSPNIVYCNCVHQ